MAYEKLLGSASMFILWDGLRTSFHFVGTFLKPQPISNLTSKSGRTNQPDWCQNRRLSKPISRNLSVFFFSLVFLVICLRENLPLDVLIHHLAVCWRTFFGFSHRQSSLFSNSSMTGKRLWISRMKEEFERSPLMSNLFFGFILTVLEKLVEMEFECPCNPKWNGLFTSAFFIVPAIMSFILMLIVQQWRCDTRPGETFSPFSFVPVLVWLTLVFLDGQYFACAMTDWEGRFVLLEKAAPHRWCEPISDGNVTSQERMLRSQKQFVISQVSQLFLLASQIYTLRFYCQSHEKLPENLESVLTACSIWPFDTWVL